MTLAAPPTARLVQLTEYRASERPVPLTRGQLQSLQRVAPSVTVQPSMEVDGAYYLKPSSHVGVVRIPDLTILIRPKLDISRVLFLLSYALDPVRWADLSFSFADEPNLLEAIVPAFVAQTRRAVRRGLLQGYIHEEDSLMTIRGRVRFDDQIRVRQGRLLPVEVSYDEFTSDILKNKLLKAAIDRLSRMALRSPQSALSLRQLSQWFVAVSQVSYSGESEPQVHYTRLNQHYRPAAELARLILRSTTVELRSGHTESLAFLVDMNQVFEHFAVVALREAIGLSHRRLRHGATLRLDVAGRITIQPDLSWWDGNACVFVGDLKYKEVDDAGVNHSDLYQLLAYAIATDLPEGLLIYGAGSGEEVAHQVLHIGRRLRVASVDLSESPEEILKKVGALSEVIRAGVG